MVFQHCVFGLELTDECHLIVRRAEAGPRVVGHLNRHAREYAQQQNEDADIDRVTSCQVCIAILQVLLPGWNVQDMLKVF
jgi:Holliday junction resolvasome RuvABC ATP-dependent DNA helicase subunit